MSSNRTNRILIMALILSIGLLLAVKSLHDHQRQLREQRAARTVEKKLHMTNSVSSQVMSGILYPYVVYASLSTLLTSLPTAEVRDFLTRYSDTPLADKLRKKWLPVLANQEQWALFLQFYQNDTNSDLQCFYATALLKTGQVDQAYRWAEKLWMVPRSQSPACNMLFTAWMTTQPLSVEEIWQRFHMVLQAGNVRVAQYLITLLPESTQPQATLWLDVRAKPTLILDTAYFKNDDDTLDDIIIYGLQQMAQQNPARAADSWRRLREYHHFTATQAQLVIQALAVGFIKSDSSSLANIWLQQLDPAYLDSTTKHWRLLFALQEQNWALLRQWIEQLAPSDRTTSKWQYWYARALEQTNELEAAQKIYNTLATQPNYYGFMAAYRLHRSIMIENQTQPITANELQSFLNTPGIQRMLALYAIGQRTWGNEEWWFAIRQMSQKQRYIAAEMAMKWQYYWLGVVTSAYLSNQNNFNLSYPMPYEQQVKKIAESLSINPAFVYAVIRQESLFNPQAISYAGAVGLMQLMPATANMLVKDNPSLLSGTLDLMKPSINIQLGMTYLYHLLSKNHDSPALTAAAYNAGPNKIKSWLPKQGFIDLDIWIDSIPYPETRQYVQNVLTYTVIYQSLLEGQVSLDVLLQPVSSN